MRNFCGVCGSSTLTQCPSGCGWPIEAQRSRERRGNFASPYCPNCGAAYPWTLTAIEDANSYIDTLVTLTPEQRAETKAAIKKVVDGSDSPALISKLKSLLAASGPHVAKTVMDVLSRVASSTVVDLLKGGGF